MAITPPHENPTLEITVRDIIELSNYLYMFNVRRKLASLWWLQYALIEAQNGNPKYTERHKSAKKNRLKLQEVERKIQAYELTLVENILTQL